MKKLYRLIHRCQKENEEMDLTAIEIYDVLDIYASRMTSRSWVRYHIRLKSLPRTEV